MTDHPFMPFTASLLAVLGIFLSALLAFDLVFVRWLKLSKLAWKRVDYVWLGFSFLGVLGAVAEVRMTSAAGQIDIYKQRAAVTYDAFKSLADEYAKDPGVLCRKFVRSEAYPRPEEEFKKLQNEYDMACAWAKDLSQNMWFDKNPDHLSRTGLPPRPIAFENSLKEIFRDLDKQYSYFDRNMRELDALRKQTIRTPLEEGFIYLAPFLFSLAVALRITKVTGEIKLGG